MPVIYGDNKIIPAPIFTLTKNYVTADNGDRLGTTYTIALNGTIVPYMGSPRTGLTTPSGDYWNGNFWNGPGYPPDEMIEHDKRLAAIERKQEEIRKLFATEGLSFEAQTPDGSSPPIKCNPRVAGPIEFQQGIWVDRCDYTVILEADVLYAGPSTIVENDFAHASKIKAASESWQTEEAEFQGTYRVTHNVSAVGKKFFDENGQLEMPAWQQARRFVLETAVLGFSSGIVINSSGVGVGSSYKAYNHVRSESIDELGGAYSVTESYILQTGIVPAVETFSITDKTDPNGRKTIGIDGEVQGLYETLNRRQDRYSNADSYFNGVQDNLLYRIQTYAKLTPSPIPISYSIVRNPNEGKINYSYEYNNRPTTFINGAIVESIEVQDNNPADIIAQIPIPGRLAGPILQDVRARTPRTRQISITAQMAASSGTISLSAEMARKPDTNSIVSGLVPQNYRKNFSTQDTDNWDFINGNYSRQTVFTWESI